MPVRTLSFSYDTANRLTSANDPSASYTYSYDALDRATTVNTSIAGLVPSVTFNQTFDASGNRTQLAAKIGTANDFTNGYTYDTLNRLTKLTQTGTSGAGNNTVSDKRVDFGYNAASQFTSINRYSNLPGTQLVASSAYTYDGTGRLTGLTHSKSGTTFAGYNWSYDPANRITAFTNSAHADENATYSVSGRIKCSHCEAKFGAGDWSG